MVTPLLPVRIDGVSVRKNGQTILGPISHVLEGRGITAVMGPNGAGKTTFLRALHGIERLATGRIEWPVDEGELHRRQALVFQTPALMRRSTLDCIAYPLRLDGLARKAARDIAAEAAAKVGLEGRLHQPVQSLSGGERQKMALARALTRAPDLLLLDEPCANLDSRSTRDIEAILIAARDAGTRLVIATHDRGQARRLADDVLFLLGGRLHESGPAAEFLDHPATPEARAYLNGDLLP